MPKKVASKKPKHLISLKVKLRGIPWKFLFFSAEDFVQQADPDDGPLFEESNAVTVSDKSTIYFNIDVVRLRDVRHELLHAYVSTFHLQSANLTAAQMEEIIADFIADSWEEYGETCKKVWEKYSEYTERDVAPADTKQNKKRTRTLRKNDQLQQKPVLEEAPDTHRDLQLAASPAK